ncbi:MAG: hypothetical protein KVP17_000811 [Porospora cf. gigantea B]|uniref:uncharacterized protein n=1 Tax=Porospora cf. gigantea B TaxID=2853592 RepID=UPI003571D09D|nr:MAG: hypothetical protein KVP17_000811 [Porospora cf. gigantea B]
MNDSQEPTPVTDKPAQETKSSVWVPPFRRGVKSGRDLKEPSANLTGRTWHNRDGRSSRGRYGVHEPHVEFGAADVGLNFDSYDDIPVSMTGDDAESIEPVSSFFGSVSSLPPQLLENIGRMKYSKPTPVQKYAIPSVLAKRNLMACAQTGSGKTAAFLWPIITLMVKSGPPPTLDSFQPAPVALILSPIRELAKQILTEAQKFAYHTGIKCCVVNGGADIGQQQRIMEAGCDILVATPGRLIGLLHGRKIRLQSCRYLVLDEADRMLDMGFTPQIKEIVRHADMCKDRQTVMFSATFPTEIQELAKNFMNNYLFLTVGRIGSTSEFIKQHLIQTRLEDDKPRKLLELIAATTTGGLMLIFVETKRKAAMIEKFLLGKQIRAVSIHGDKNQREREAALEYFRNGAYPVMVATDVAARGLDISNVNHVVNCDLPNNIEDYVHRIGRTGRAGKEGLASSFVSMHNKPILRDLLTILHESHQQVPSWFMEMVKDCTSARGGGRPMRGAAGRGSSSRHTFFGARDVRQGRSDFNNNSSTGAGFSRRPVAPSYQTKGRGADDDSDGW